MKDFQTALVVAYIVAGSFVIWATTIITGFMFLFSEFSFMYNVMPFAGIVAIYYLIKHGLEMIRIINKNE